MRQLNMAIDDEAYQAAKDGARDAGMLLRTWVARAILEYRAKLKGNTDAPPPAGGKELQYVPTDDA